MGRPLWELSTTLRCGHAMPCYAWFHFQSCDGTTCHHLSFDSSQPRSCPKEESHIPVGNWGVQSMITWRLLEILLDCQMEVAWRYCWSSFQSMERLSNVETRSRTEVESPMLSNLWKSQQSKSLQVIPESWMLKRWSQWITSTSAEVIQLCVKGDKQNQRQRRAHSQRPGAVGPWRFRSSRTWGQLWWGKANMMSQAETTRGADSHKVISSCHGWPMVISRLKWSTLPTNTHIGAAWP